MSTISFQRLFRLFLDFICQLLEFFYPDERAYLPPIKNPLLLLPATELVKKIKLGKLSSETLLQAYIDRINQVQPLINAIVDERFDDALKEARDLDTLITSQIKQNGQISASLEAKPLLGIPYTGKDCIPAKGMIWSTSIPARKEIRADRDSSDVQMYREAGAIIIAMTTVPELLLWWDTCSVTWGRTFNPYNRSAIVGGSTGGNGALISACGSPLGIAGDIGGSIRIPANFNGIFGHCCSNGTTQHDLHWPPSVEERLKMLYTGPLVRYAADLLPVVKMYTKDSKHASVLRLDEDVNLSSLKFYFLTEIRDPALSKVDPEIKQMLSKVSDFLNDIGAEVKHVHFDEMIGVFDMWMSMMQVPNSNPMAFEMTNRNGVANLYLELFKALFGASKHSFPVIFTAIYRDILLPLFVSPNSNRKQKYLEQRDKLHKKFNDLLGDDGVLILPTFPLVKVKPPATFLQFKNTCYTGVFNCFNTAITQIPMGLSQDGFPLGFQAITKHLNDRLTIKLAVEIEKRFGGWVPPTSVQL